MIQDIKKYVQGVEASAANIKQQQNVIRYAIHSELVKRGRERHRDCHTVDIAIDNNASVGSYFLSSDVGHRPIVICKCPISAER